MQKGGLLVRLAKVYNNSKQLQREKIIAYFSISIVHRAINKKYASRNSQSGVIIGALIKSEYNWGFN